LIRLILALWVALTCGDALAHKPSDSYLSLRVEGKTVTGQWDIALRDLDVAIGMDGDGDGKLTWDEIRARHGEIAAYAMARLSLASDGGACTLLPGPQLLDRHTDGAYTVIRLTGSCPAPVSRLTLRYSLFAETDAQHKGLLRLDANGITRSAVFGTDRPEQSLLLDGAGKVDTLRDYVGHGVWHIWIGFDHILFLATLLLPAVLVWRNGKWHPGDGWRPAAIDTLKVVSAFTVAHSLTLSAAALGAVSLPSRWVESAIAASVVIAAANNIVPIVQGRRWVAAFAFGLVHGFGFASVLAGLGLPDGSLALALFGFNVGVELGQLAIVAIFLPLACLVRNTWFYRRVVVAGGSAVAAVLASVWLVERAFDITFTA
jgi:hypothetical protein